MQLHIILFSVSKSHEYEHEGLPDVWLVISFNEKQTRRIHNTSNLRLKANKKCLTAAAQKLKDTFLLRY